MNHHDDECEFSMEWGTTKPYSFYIFKPAFEYVALRRRYQYSRGWEGEGGAGVSRRKVSDMESDLKSDFMGIEV